MYINLFIYIYIYIYIYRHIPSNVTVTLPNLPPSTHPSEILLRVFLLFLEKLHYILTAVKTHQRIFAKIFACLVKLSTLL